MTAKITLIKLNVVAFILLTFTVWGCKKNETAVLENEYRQIAWNYLNASSNATITTKLQDSKVTSAIYKDQEAVSVTFNTTQDALLGPIVVYISVQTKTVLGIAPRF